MSSLTNLMQFVVKSILIRNSNRDKSFNKYKAYYDSHHCSICDKEGYDRMLCIKCNRFACQRNCFTSMTWIEEYWCVNCSPKCNLCGASQCDELYLCECNAIVCENCMITLGDEDSYYMVCNKCCTKCYICGEIEGDFIICNDCNEQICEYCLSYNTQICKKCSI